MRNWKFVPAILWLAIGVPWLVIDLVIALFLSCTVDFEAVRAVLITLAAWIGLPVLIWRTLIADKQTAINRESHYAELFTKSIELLSVNREGKNGTQVVAVESRIGAIFALERLAKQSEKDYGSILETLCSYVRQHCGAPLQFQFGGKDPDEPHISNQEREVRLKLWHQALNHWVKELREAPPANRPDVFAAISVLCRRKEGRSWTRANLYEFQPDLSQINLQGANFSEITAEIVRDEMHFSNAFLEGVVLSGTQLEGCELMYPIPQETASGTGAGPVSLIGARIENLKLLRPNTLPILDGADLRGAILNEIRGHGARLRGATLRSAQFRLAQARDAKFGFADLTGASFDDADLRWAEFMGAVLNETSFVGANLEGAVFRGASLEAAKLEGALLVNTDLRGTNDLAFGAIANAFGAADTPLPSNLDRPAHWIDHFAAFEKWKEFRMERGTWQE